jgi:hypothetical protein
VSTRKLNIPALGFEVVVVGASTKTNELIGDLLEKKIAEEIVEDDEPQGCRYCSKIDGCACTGGVGLQTPVEVIK